MASEAGHFPNRAYFSQAGNLHANGAKIYNGAGNDMLAGRPASLTLTPAKGGSANVCDVTIQVVDENGNACAAVFQLDVWLSDDTTAAAGLTATTASGTVTNGTAGGIVQATYTAKKALRVQTLATGAFVLEITDTAKTAFVVAAQCPGTGQTFLTTLAAGNYD